MEIARFDEKVLQGNRKARQRIYEERFQAHGCIDERSIRKAVLPKAVKSQMLYTVLRSKGVEIEKAFDKVHRPDQYSMKCALELIKLPGQNGNTADAVRERGATAMYLFGSTARDEATADSDVDVFIEYNPKKKFSLIDLLKIKHYLEDKLGCPVDAFDKEGLRPRVRSQAVNESIRIF